MIKQQGSNRVYTREQGSDGKSLIRVQGTNRDENRAFIYMARHFRAMGLPVPEVYDVSDDEMSYTQQDLGDTILFDTIAQGRQTGAFSAHERELLERTLRALAHIQIEGAQDFDWSMCFPVPAMDERSIRWDLNYFKYCFLKGTKIEFSEPQLEDEFDRLTATILAQPAETFLYRDFQSRNVMIVNDQPYFIDFQGGRRGPLAYDVASFLWQAKANIPSSLRAQLIDAYWDEVARIHLGFVDKQAFMSALPHFVLFRTLQVLGAYGYRGYFERKPHFLQSIPNALRNLREVLNTLNDQYPYLHSIAEELTKDPKDLKDPRGPRDPRDLTVTVYSFSYKRGIPADESGNGGGYVFDCRSTHNPGRYEQYKALTGLDKPVIDFLERDGEILTFLEHVDALVDHHVERYIERCFTHLQVSFGCTGGQHRSVYCAEHVAAHIHDKYGVQVQLIHREQDIKKLL